MSRFGWGAVPLLLSVLASCRGVVTGYRYPDDLTHPNYVKRSQAVREFAATQDRSQLPRVFGLLNDPEAHIRAIAHRGLRALMPGEQDFGFEPSLPEQDRVRIAATWRSWWEAEAGAGAAGNAAAEVPGG